MAISAATAATVGSAALGAISGGKKNKSSQQSSTVPVLPDNVKAGFDKTIADATNIANTPYPEMVRMRAEPSGMFGGLFNNPEMMAIQQKSDGDYFAKMLAPKVAPQQPQQPQQSQIDDLRAEMLGRSYLDKAKAAGRMNGTYMPENQFNPLEIGKIIVKRDADPNTAWDFEQQLIRMGLGRLGDY
jgi:hypothetical protein